ncbi:hypothetical protein MHYP_G00185510 [Metynnis hypsauchen]
MYTTSLPLLTVDRVQGSRMLCGGGKCLCSMAVNRGGVRKQRVGHQGLVRPEAQAPETTLASPIMGWECTDLVILTLAFLMCAGVVCMCCYHEPFPFLSPDSHIRSFSPYLWHGVSTGQALQILPRPSGFHSAAKVQKSNCAWGLVVKVP